jgi:hypothetical protein
MVTGGGSPPRHPYDLVEEEAIRRGYWFPSPQLFNLFVFGVRGPDTSTNLFDDVIGAVWRDSRGEMAYLGARATTDPGRAALDHPTRRAGTATVLPGQHRGLWAPGLHQGRYRALVQGTRPAPPVWRGRSSRPDPERVVYHDAAGINLHHGAGAARVDWYSAGCQVVQDPRDLAAILALVDAQAAAGLGDVVSYTLFDVRTSPSLAGLLPAPGR